MVDAGKSRRNLGGRLEEDVWADEAAASWSPVESSAMMDRVNLGERDWWRYQTKMVWKRRNLRKTIRDGEEFN